MNAKAATVLAKCYPAAWRRRYGREFETLLLELPLSLRLVCDVFVQAALLRRRAIAVVATAAIAAGGGALALNHSTTTPHSRLVSVRHALPPCNQYTSTSAALVQRKDRCLT